MVPVVEYGGGGAGSSGAIADGALPPSPQLLALLRPSDGSASAVGWLCFGRRVAVDLTREVC
ncbi:hypothetical protein E2562_000507 [Oryza meyeriana var. granulata]|uniref:Uncharacterized protein n=1 Tax=Oryza meyeriana var. granulata TaxID=110450 RepID=A0A6G1CC69_9ORYZ|nr:hypothetical protein E2562_000507 [Oryza meyeriana var. granulata]